MLNMNNRWLPGGIDLNPLQEGGGGTLQHSSVILLRRENTLEFGMNDMDQCPWALILSAHLLPSW